MSVNKERTPERPFEPNATRLYMRQISKGHMPTEEEQMSLAVSTLNRRTEFRAAVLQNPIAIVLLHNTYSHVSQRKSDGAGILEEVIKKDDVEGKEKLKSVLHEVSAVIETMLLTISSHLLANQEDESCAGEIDGELKTIHGIFEQQPAQAKFLYQIFKQCLRKEKTEILDLEGTMKTLENRKETKSFVSADGKTILPAEKGPISTLLQALHSAKDLLEECDELKKNVEVGIIPEKVYKTFLGIEFVEEIELIKDTYEVFASFPVKDKTIDYLANTYRSLLSLLHIEFFDRSSGYVQKEDNDDKKTNYLAGYRKLVKGKFHEYQIAKKDQADMHVLLAASIARKFRGSGIEMAELIQVANLGLMKAVERHDYRKGKLTTFATTVIEKTIQKAISEGDSAVRIPQKNSQELTTVYDSIKEYWKIHKKRPHLLQIADITGIAAIKVQKLLRRRESIHSLERYVRDTEYTELPYRDDDEENPIGTMGQSEFTFWRNLLPEKPSDEADPFEQEEVRSRILKAIGHLTYRTQEVIKLRFGLSDGYEYTYEEIGQVFKITKERVRQILVRGKRSIQESLLLEEFKRKVSERD